MILLTILQNNVVNKYMYANVKMYVNDAYFNEIRNFLDDERLKY